MGSFQHVDFSGSDLRGASFVNVILDSIDFTGALLAGVDFSSATIRSTKFIDTDLNHTLFTGATVVNADFGGSSVVSSSDLQRPNMTLEEYRIFFQTWDKCRNG